MSDWLPDLPWLRPPPPVTAPPPSRLVVAHRGGLAHAPENSLAAIREAASRQADAVELDVRMCGGQLICAHDAGRPGPPAREAVELALSLGMRVELDLKSHGADDAIRQVVGLLDDLGAHERTWVSTFYPMAAWRLRWADPRLVVGWAVARSVVQRLPLWSGWSDWLGVQVVAPEFGLLSPARLAHWATRPVVVEAWGIPRHEVQACLDQGMSVVVDHLE